MGAKLVEKPLKWSSFLHSILARDTQMVTPLGLREDHSASPSGPPQLQKLSRLEIQTNKLLQLPALTDSVGPAFTPMWDEG